MLATERVRLMIKDDEELAFFISLQKVLDHRVIFITRNLKKASNILEPQLRWIQGLRSIIQLLLQNLERWRAERRYCVPGFLRQVEVYAPYKLGKGALFCL